MARKLLVIGASGLLGSKLMAQAGRTYDAVGTFNPEVDGKDLWRLESLDIGSKEEVDSLFRQTSPEVVILTAAMTNVDACERDQLVANRVNASGPSMVARACKTAGARLVHVSTDYVFDGRKTRRYLESDVPRPISVYGSSKLAGERSVLSAYPAAAVARTAVLYGWNPIEGKENFVTWALKKLRAGEKVTMFSDQHISPTFADDLASALLGIAETGASGVLHASGPDCLDRVECGKLIAEVFGLDKGLVVPVRSDSLSLPARRPAYSCLDVSKVENLLNRKMMTFEAGLRQMKEQEGGRR
ncbi:MAG: dTDP-4-dehydrorhamnose reductase [Thermoplasmata archaeon]|nr:dTDP-4-dehydrorhamnose reductase [Thermoplasmata archaeon]